ncbi:MAG: hypothetical protein ACE5ES_01275 [Candidatus Nanoarchaeia archaeon]
MGLIRGGTLTIVAVLLFLSLLVGNLFLTTSLSLDFETVKSELRPIVKEIAENQTELSAGVERNFPTMEQYCQNYSDFVFKNDETGHTFTIPCNVVAEGQEAVIEFGLNQLIEESYSQAYECGFWECLGSIENSFVLVSEKAKDYWKSRFYFSLVISLILAILIFLLAEKKSNAFILMGVLIVISSLPFSKIDVFLSSILGILLFFVSADSVGLEKDSLLDFLIILFTKSFNVFLIVLVIGVIIFLIGIILKFFSVGFWISNFLQRSSQVKKATSFDKIQKAKKSQKPVRKPLLMKK